MGLSRAGRTPAESLAVTPAEIRKARRSRKYREWRKQHIAENRLCAICLLSGTHTLATEFDHIEPAHRRPDLFWSDSNVQGLCLSCHEIKTAEENRRPDSPKRAAWREQIRSRYGDKAAG